MQPEWSKLKAGALVICGSEPFLRRRALRGIRDAHTERVISVFQGKGKTWRHLTIDLEAADMMGKGLLVEVIDAKNVKGDMAEFLMWLGDPTDAIVVFEVDSLKSKLPKALKTMVKFLPTYEFNTLKEHGSPSEIAKWLVVESKALGIKLPVKLSDALVKRYRKNVLADGDNVLELLLAEITNISAFMGWKGAVTPEILKQNIGPRIIAKPFAVIEAAFDGDERKLLLNSGVYFRGARDDSGAANALVATLEKEATRLLGTKSIRHLGDDKATELLGVHPYVYSKVIRPRSERIDEDDIVWLMGTLCELETLLRTSMVSPRAATESVLIDLSRRVSA